MVGGIGGICQQRGEVISVKYRAEILSGDRNLLSRIYTSFGAPSPTRTASPHLGYPTIPTILQHCPLPNYPPYFGQPSKKENKTKKIRNYEIKLTEHK